MPLSGEQKREYQRAWIAARRESWIESKGGKCVRCGRTDSLEVDHIDPQEKQISVSLLWSRSEEVRTKELDKCQILCTDCHKEKTRKDFGFEFKHGTDVGYTYYMCRCVLCKAAHAKYNRDWRKKQSKKAANG